MLMNIMAGLLKTELRNFCTLNFVDAADSAATGVDAPIAFVCDDSSMMTLIRINGMLDIAGKHEYGKLGGGLFKVLATLFSRTGTTLQWCFRRDDDATRRLTEMYAPSLRSAKVHGLDIDSLIEDNISALSKWAHDEESIIAIWTHPNAIPKDVVKRRRDESVKLRQRVGASYRDAGDPVRVISELRQRHYSAVRSLTAELQNAGVLNEVLDVHAACTVMRRYLDKDGLHEGWRPRFPGDKLWLVEDDAAFARKDLSSMMYPSVSRQLFPRPHEPVPGSAEEIRCGHTYYSAIAIEFYPQQQADFEQLLRSIDKDIPFRVSFHLAPASAASLSWRRMAASWVKRLGEMNAHAHDELDKLLEGARNGDPALIIRTMFVTWHHSVERLRVNASRLNQAIQGWGICDTSTDSARPSESVVTSCPGINPQSSAPACFGPLSRLLRLLPIDRPTTIFDSGTMVMRSTDNKLVPFMPASIHQDTWFDAQFGPPGRGKSVASQSLNMASILVPGYDRLPRLVVIDVGPSSIGLIACLKHRLPENRQHEALSYRFSLASPERVNVFDLPLGARTPPPLHSTFLRNFLTLLATPPASENRYATLPMLIGHLIDEIYKTFADEKYAQRFQPGLDPVLEKALNRAGITPTPLTSWYALADALFDAGDIENAARAQAYGVPTLSQSVSFLQSSATLRDMYGEKSNARTEDGQSLAEAYQLFISAAIRDYPILDGTTTLRFENARILALDLEEVTGGDDRVGVKQTALMYMLARHVGASDWYLHEDSVHLFEPRYREYQYKRIKRTREDIKRLVYDELHRASKAPSAIHQVFVDGREGRKHGTHVSIATQVPGDIPEDLAPLISNVFIFSGGTEKEIRDLERLFGLTETEKLVMRSNILHGPRAGGPCFLYKYNSKYGWRSQVLYLTKGPLEIWTYSTTKEDRLLRESLTRLAGYDRALQMLSTMYPNGSAREEVDRRRKAMGELQRVGEQMGEIIDRLAAEIYERMAFPANESEPARIARKAASS